MFRIIIIIILAASMAVWVWGQIKLATQQDWSLILIGGAVEGFLIALLGFLWSLPLTPQRKNFVYKNCSDNPQIWAEEHVAESARELYEYAALAAQIYEDSSEEITGWSRLDFAGDDEEVGLRCGIWISKLPSQCPIVAVVFRGTRSISFKDGKLTLKPLLADWQANLRWMLRGRRDHYTVIAEKPFQEGLIKTLESWARDNSIATFSLVAVGHSLGGGLAQCFAYTFPKNTNLHHISVSRVYAFDSSPVTARRSADTGLHSSITDTLTIHQVFERGEVLAVLRMLFNRKGHKYPRVCTYRFNFTKILGPIKNHAMYELAKALAELRRTSTVKPTMTDRLEQLRMIYDYIKFHIGLYVGTPPVLIILAQSLGVEKDRLFVYGMVDMVLLYLFAGGHAAWFMGTHINRRWSSDYLDEFEEAAFKPMRAFWHHWMYWAGLIVGLLGLALAWFTRGSISPIGG